jgi:hypothetical protein
VGRNPANQGSLQAGPRQARLTDCGCGCRKIRDIGEEDHITRRQTHRYSISSRWTFNNLAHSCRVAASIAYANPRPSPSPRAARRRHTAASVLNTGSTCLAVNNAKSFSSSTSASQMPTPFRLASALLRRPPTYWRRGSPVNLPHMTEDNANEMHTGPFTGSLVG